ncbi:hypothetical protein BKP42_53820 [Rhodococcus erythropolis]|nr:hypothetical protein BKP42_53820 [Rhodococcus erythropolis]
MTYRHGSAATGVAGTSPEHATKHPLALSNDKEELYRFVAARELDAVAEATQLDPADLPGYAGRVHDYFVANPDNRRIMRWAELEFVGTDDAARETARNKTAKLRRAQQDGLLDPSWDPLDVLVFVSQLASAWADQPGLPAPKGVRDQFLADRRAAIVAAVERLFPASDPDTRLEGTFER